MFENIKIYDRFSLNRKIHSDTLCIKPIISSVSAPNTKLLEQKMRFISQIPANSFITSKNL